MSLRPPNLDDRRFDDLLADSLRRIQQSCPGWTDLSPGDPGVVLLEVFAHLTEIMLYRLNRVPEKAYVEFLRLMGVRLEPPAAARVELRFTLARPQGRPVEIPRGTRVGAERGTAGEPPVFVTAETVGIPAGAESATVLAHHCELVQAELAGQGTGMPGLMVGAARPPIVAATGSELDLVVGVETEAQALPVGTPAVKFGDKVYRVWREVSHFTDLGANRFAYLADRLSGEISFAPAVRAPGADDGLEKTPSALAEIPPAGREIRLWYRRGGGPDGNVNAATLTVLKDPIPGVAVTNPGRAVGGREAESLENALLRGPQTLHALQRAVTARDFELLAVQSSGAVDRAQAFTSADLWSFAAPGTVEVILVPFVPATERRANRLDRETLVRFEDAGTLAQIRKALDRRRALGTSCLLRWARYKPVTVKARVVVHREETPQAVGERVRARLDGTISPLAVGGEPWPFGQSLTAWDLYKILSSEPGVNRVDGVRLVVDEVPEAEVKALAADAHQPHTWYAAAGEKVFRSLNDGDGWEPAGRFPGQEVDLVEPYPREAAQPHRQGTRAPQAGLVAVATRVAGEALASRLHFSRDCGETWEAGTKTNFRVEDMAWLNLDGQPGLLLATEAGLYSLAFEPRATPLQVVVDPNQLGLGFYAVAVSTDAWGATSVAVAAREKGGVFLSGGSGRSNTYKRTGLVGQDIRVLAVQHRGPNRFLWAGAAAVGSDAGTGCQRWRLTGEEDNPEGWRAYAKDWNAGSCLGLACLGSRVLAGTRRGGVRRLDVNAQTPKWVAPRLDCGLPLRDAERLLQPVESIASDPAAGLVLAGGVKGVHRSSDGGEGFAACSTREFAHEVTLPKTWLFCSGEHEIEVVSEDET